MPTAYRLLPTAFCLPPSAYCLQVTLLVVWQVVELAGAVGVAQLVEEAREVDRVSAEGENAVFARPQVGGTVPGKLDAVEVRIVQVDGLLGAVVGSAVDAP